MKQGKLIALHEVAEGRATHLKVEVYYSKGGMNYFSGNSEKRGLYLSVSPVSRSTDESGRYTTESFTAFSGTKRLVKEMVKFSQKALDSYEPSKEDIDELTKHVLEKNSIKLKQA